MLIKYNKNNQIQNITEKNDVLYSNKQHIFNIRVYDVVLEITVDKNDFFNKTDKSVILMFDMYGNVYSFIIFTYSQKVLMNIISDYDKVEIPKLEVISIENNIFNFKLTFQNNYNSVYVISSTPFAYMIKNT